MEFLLLRHRRRLSWQNVLKGEKRERPAVHRLACSWNQLYNFKNYVTKETDTYHWSCHQWQEPFSVWLVLLTLTFDICRIMKTPKGTIGYIEGSRNTANTITKTLQSEAGLHNNKTNFLSNSNNWIELVYPRYKSGQPAMKHFLDGVP